MAIKLIVVSEFNGRKVGEEITDDKEIALILGSAQAHYVTKVNHDPAADKLAQEEATRANVAEAKQRTDQATKDADAARYGGANEFKTDAQLRRESSAPSEPTTSKFSAKGK